MVKDVADPGCFAAASLGVLATCKVPVTGGACPGQEGPGGLLIHSSQTVRVTWAKNGRLLLLGRGQSKQPSKQGLCSPPPGQGDKHAAPERALSSWSCPLGAGLLLASVSHMCCRLAPKMLLGKPAPAFFSLPEQDSRFVRKGVIWSFSS